MLSLFRVVTLEDWTDVMYTNMYGCAEYGYDASSVVPCVDSQASPVLAAVFFVSFVLIGTMIMLNLFIGVIMTGMDEAQGEAEALDREANEAKGHETTAMDDLKDLEEQLAIVHASIGHLHRRMRHDADVAARAEASSQT